MKTIFLRCILVAAMGLVWMGAPVGGSTAWGTDTDMEVSAHEAVLDLAGAFTNDGFKLRDGDYEGTLKKGEGDLIQVNLFAGNQYWFSVATGDPNTAVTVSLYDENGKLLQTEPYADAHRAAAGFAPGASGPYYVRIANAGAPATFCLIYSYK
jgi:hypothetical protein